MSSPIVEADVAAYLENHPEFFSRHAELLTQISVPHQSGEAVSLVEKQIKVLRQTNKDLKARFNQLIEIARQNEQHFENTRKLLIELIDFKNRAGSIEELFEIFELRFPGTLAASEFSIIVLDRELDAQHAKLTRLKSMNSRTLKEKLPRFHEMKHAFCGALTKTDREVLFGEHAALIASLAVIPLNYKHMNALLAIGNFNESHFHKGMGTMFLDHIGEVISRVLNELLETPARQSIAV